MGALQLTCIHWHGFFSCLSEDTCTTECICVQLLNGCSKPKAGADRLLLHSTTLRANSGQALTETLQKGASQQCCSSLIPPTHAVHPKIVADTLKTVLQDGWTPLHFASYWGSLKVLRYLLNSGVNVNAQDKVRDAGQLTMLWVQDDAFAKSWLLRDSSRHCAPDHSVLKLPTSTVAAAQPAALWHRMCHGHHKACWLSGTFVVPNGWMLTQPAACASPWCRHIAVHLAGYLAIQGPSQLLHQTKFLLPAVWEDAPAPGSHPGPRQRSAGPAHPQRRP